MIQNKEQLLAMASMWTTEAKNDIRHQAMEFMAVMHVGEEQLADILGISMAELDQILRGNGEISLSTFAKIIIATDNVLEIKPLSETPFGRTPQGFPTPTEMPRMGRMGRMPNHPWRGRPSAPQNTMVGPRCDEVSMPQPTPTQRNAWDELSTIALLEEINQRGWGDNINILGLNREGLIQYIQERESEENARSQEARNLRIIDDVDFDEDIFNDDEREADDLYPSDMMEFDEIPPCSEPYWGTRSQGVEENTCCDRSNRVDELNSNKEFLTEILKELENKPEMLNELRNIIR